MNYAVSRLVAWLARRLPQPPSPPEVSMDIYARWRRLPAATPSGSVRMLTLNPLQQPRLIRRDEIDDLYDLVCAERNDAMPEPWPRWWEMPGGAEEPSAKERLG